MTSSEAWAVAFKYRAVEEARLILGQGVGTPQNTRTCTNGAPIPPTTSTPQIRYPRN